MITYMTRHRGWLCDAYQIMPGTQDKIEEDRCNVFCVHLVFIFEGFAVMDGIPKGKKLQWTIAGIYFWLGTYLKRE